MVWLMVTLAWADEGMWLPEQLPSMEERLVEMGLEIPVADLADPASPVMQSIVSLGGCSASFVSPDGLIATNHHCVEGMLAYVSDETNDRVTDGYLARSRDEELWVGPTARVSVVESITDVTARMRQGINRGMPDTARHLKLEKARKALVAGCEDETHRCRVASYFGGQEYRLIRRRELRDVRLAYAPPRSVGSYGGEIDNWEWPRHSGDFAFVRAYVSPTGEVADHAADNVPYAAPHHLTVNPEGVDEGDFVMVAGYPGSTYRYRTAREMRFSRDVSYPGSVERLEWMLAMLRDEVSTSEAAAVALHPMIFGLENGLKYRQGMLDNFAGTDVVDRKGREWGILEAWVAETPDRTRRFGPVLEELDRRQAQAEARYGREVVVGGLRYLDLLSVAHRSIRFAMERQKPDRKRDRGYQDRDVSRWKHSLKRMSKSMWLPADRRLFQRTLEQHAALPAEQQIEALSRWVTDRGGMDALLDTLFDEPALADETARLDLAEASLSELEASDDPWVELAFILEDAHWKAERDRRDAEAGAEARLMPVYMEALLQSREQVYPDANGTLRVTVGHVAGYSPEDAVVMLPQTTVAGMVAKAGPEPFDAPEFLLAAAAEAPSSPFADEALGDLPVNFTSTLDTTGGNSGSATLDASGNFVGLLFDGNYEAMSADWLFDPALTRSIHCDVRYVLWVLQQAGADALLTELGVTSED